MSSLSLPASRGLAALLLLSLLAVLLPSASATCNVASWNGKHPSGGQCGKLSWGVTQPQPPSPTWCNPGPKCTIPSLPYNCSVACQSTITLEFNTETILNTWAIVINGYYLSKTITANGGWVKIPNCDPYTVQNSWSSQPWASDVLMVGQNANWPGTSTPFFTSSWRSPSNDVYYGTQNVLGCLGNQVWAPVWQISFPYWNCSAVTVNWMMTLVNFPGAWSVVPLQLLQANTQLNSFGFTRNCPVPPPSPPSGAKGDPQFLGLRGQDYQVHGIDGGVYNVISDKYMQLNSKFVFLTGPRPCPVMPSTGKKSVACFAHSGSYLGNLALRTVTDDRVLIVPGKAADGMASVSVNGEQLEVGDVRALSFGPKHNGSITLLSAYEVLLTAGLFQLEVESSDDFLNLRSVSVPNSADWREIKEEKAHGLLGQTWRLLKGRSAIEGKVDDYLLESEDIYGSDFVYNRFGL